MTVEQNEQAMKARNMPDWLITHLVGIALIGNGSVLHREHQADPRHRQARSDHDEQFVEDFKALFV